MINESPIQFNAQKIKDIMNEEITRAFANYKYNPAQKKDKIEHVTSKIINKLSTSEQRYKFISHSVLLTKGEAEFETFTFNMWDPEKDGVTCVDYSNGDIRFIMTVWGLYCE